MKLFGDAVRNRLLPISLSQAAGVACGIIGVKIVSAFVPPPVLATYGIFLTFTTLGVWLVHAGLIKYLLRSWAGESNRGQLLRTIILEWLRRLGWLAAASVGAAIFIVRYADTSFVTTALTLFISSALLSLLACMQSILQAERSHWSDLALSATGSLGRSFAAPLAFIFISKTAATLFWGFACYTAVNAAIGVGLLRHYVAMRAGNASERSALPAVYLGPLFATLAFATWSLYGVNRWLVAWRFDDVFAGWFTFAGNLGSLVAAVLGGIFIQFFQPGLYALADTGTHGREALPKRIDLLSLALGMAGVAALILLWAISPLLVGPLIAERYRASLEWILPTGCFALTIVTSQFYHIMLLAHRYERACAKMDLTTAAVMIAIAFISVLFGRTAFWWGLTLSPLTTWVVSRPLTHALLAPRRALPSTPATAH